MTPRLASTVAAAACLSSLLSCWAPIYDPEVSGSVDMADKLGDPILSIGPISGEGRFDSREGLEFLPARPMGRAWAPTDGFLVYKGEDDIKIAFVESEGGGYRFAPASQGRANYLGSDAILRSEAASASDYPQMIAMADHATAQQYRFDRSTRSFSQQDTPISGGSGVVVYGPGASLSSPSSDTDTYTALFASGAGLFVSSSAIGNSLTNFANLTTLPLSTGGMSLRVGGSAFIDPVEGRFYYSEPGGPTFMWNTATWTASPPLKLPIPKRVTALLADGTLIAQDDLHLSAYTAGGEEIFTTMAGSIRLEHEVYCPGPAPAEGFYLIFSQVLVAKGSGSSGFEYRIKVWRYPQAALAKLGD
jgi:hypothetical protein